MHFRFSVTKLVKSSCASCVALRGQTDQHPRSLGGPVAGRPWPILLAGQHDHLTALLTVTLGRVKHVHLTNTASGVIHFSETTTRTLVCVVTDIEVWIVDARKHIGAENRKHGQDRFGSGSQRYKFSNLILDCMQNRSAGCQLKEHNQGCKQCRFYMKRYRRDRSVDVPVCQRPLTVSPEGMWI